METNNITITPQLVKKLKNKTYRKKMLKSFKKILEIIDDYKRVM